MTYVMRQSGNSDHITLVVIDPQLWLEAADAVNHGAREVADPQAVLETAVRSSGIAAHENAPRQHHGVKPRREHSRGKNKAPANTKAINLHKRRRAELLEISKPLELRRVHELHDRARESNVSVNRVVENFRIRVLQLPRLTLREEVHFSKLKSSKLGLRRRSRLHNAVARATTLDAAVSEKKP